MERVRAFDVAQEGFRLVMRQPKAVLVWGLLIAVLQTVVPLAGAAWLFASQDGLFQLAMSSERGADIEALSDFEAKVNLFQIAAFPLVLFAESLVTAAVLRAMLEPEASRGFYLRIGKAEGWLMLVGLAALILLLTGCLSVIALIALATWITAMVSEAAAVVLATLLGIGAFAALLWICIRLMMAMPMTFTAREFRLFESWRLTKGHGWFLVRVWAAMVFLLLAAAVAVGIGIVILVIVPLVVIVAPLARSAEGADPAIWFSQHLGLLIGLGLPYLGLVAFLSGAQAAIIAAPIARAFQILTGPTAASPLGDSETSSAPAT